MVLKKVKFQVKSDQPMRKFALLFLFASVVSLTLFDFAFAQVDEGIDEETMMEDEMMQTTSMGSKTLPPLQQLSMGVDPHDIECREGQQLVFKASNWQPACINEPSYSILYARGWIASHDPTHADLDKMVKKHMGKHQ
jgi:hypothetical protein